MEFFRLSSRPARADSQPATLGYRTGVPVAVCWNKRAKVNKWLLVAVDNENDNVACKVPLDRHEVTLNVGPSGGSPSIIRHEMGIIMLAFTWHNRHAAHLS